MALDSIKIDVTSKQALNQLENFTKQIDAAHQVRGKVLARDEDGNITQIRLYTRKNNLQNAVTTEGRGKKYKAAREGINAILSRHTGGPLNKYLNMLEDNSDKLLGTRLQAALAQDRVLVNTKTTMDQLHKLSDRGISGNQMRGIDNKDGTYILYSKNTSSTFRRRDKFTAFDRGVKKVFSNMKRQDPKLGTLMENLYDEKAVKAGGGPVLKGRQFNAGIREAKTQSYDKAISQLGAQLAGKLPELQNHLLNRLNNEALAGDPMRENLGKDKIYAALKKIEAGKMHECTPAELIKAVQFISKSNPAMPIDTLTQLAKSDDALRAAGPYTGKNTPNKKLVPFDSQNAQPNHMQQAALNLRQAINKQLTPQEKAALRSRVEFTAKLAALYDEKIGLCGSGNEQGDNTALWVKSFNVNIGNQTGHDPAELVPGIGGRLLAGLSTAKEQPLNRQHLQSMIPELRAFAENKPEKASITKLIDKLSNKLQQPQLNENEVKDLLSQLEGLVRRDAGIAPRDLMTALVLHKDIIFPTESRLHELNSQIAKLDQDLNDLQEDQDRAVTPTEDKQLQQQIDGLRLRKNKLVQQHTTMQQVLSDELRYQEEHEVMDLCLQKEQLQNDIVQARYDRRWGDAVRDLAKLDRFIAANQDKLALANKYNLPTENLHPQIRARVEKEIPQFQAQVNQALTKAKNNIDESFEFTLGTLKGNTQQTFVNTCIETMSDEKTVRNELEQHLDDPAYSKDNFIGISPHQDPKKFVARFKNGKELVLSNRGFPKRGIPWSFPQIPAPEYELQQSKRIDRTELQYPARFDADLCGDRSQELR